MIISCGKKEMNSIILPSNEATEVENLILSAALNKIQADFDELGVNVNLRSIPYHVAKLDGTPIGIVINHDLFNYWGSESEFHYGPIYKILLHEIGHFFFGRRTENPIWNSQR